MRAIFKVAVYGAFLAVIAVSLSTADAAQTAAVAATRAIGTVQSISGNSFTLFVTNGAPGQLTSWFSSVTVPGLPSGASGLSWDTNKLAVGRRCLVGHALHGRVIGGER